MMEDSDDNTSTTASQPDGYVQEQAKAVGRLSRKSFQCIACTEDFRVTNITSLPCTHQYCDVCLKEFIMRGVIEHDLALIPPRCCGQPLPQSVISHALDEANLKALLAIEVEKDTQNKVYCSSAKCGEFIAPIHISSGTAICPCCGLGTCATCRSPAHGDECSEDPSLQPTLELGVNNHWQRCFSCRSLVAIEWGCNHMT